MRELCGILARKLHLTSPVMKWVATGLCLLALAMGVHADIVELNNGKRLAGRVAGYTNDLFELLPTNAAPVQVPANTVAVIEFSKGTVLATVELPGQKPLDGKIWLYARGAFNFEDDKGETTRIPLAKLSRVSFSAQPVPEKPAPPARSKPASPSASSTGAPKLEVISRGDRVDIKDHCVPGKITIVDFYADWCEPCRSIGPILEDRVNRDPDLILRKINIDKWDSPVSQQYSIHAIPFLQVYDRRGNKIGDLTGFNNEFFESLLKRAR